MSWLSVALLLQQFLELLEVGGHGVPDTWHGDWSSRRPGRRSSSSTELVTRVPLIGRSKHRRAWTWPRARSFARAAAAAGLTMVTLRDTRTFYSLYSDRGDSGSPGRR
jgi:hypothetical protein